MRPSLMLSGYQFTDWLEAMSCSFTLVMAMNQWSGHSRSGAYRSASRRDNRAQTERSSPAARRPPASPGWGGRRPSRTGPPRGSPCPCGPWGIHQLEEGQVVLPAHPGVVPRRTRGDVDVPGTVGHGDVIVGHHPPGALVHQIFLEIKQRLVGQPTRALPGISSKILSSASGPSTLSSRALPMMDGAAFPGHPGVGFGGVHAQGHVAGQGPGGWWPRRTARCRSAPSPGSARRRSLPSPSYSPGRPRGWTERCRNGGQ